MKQASPVHFVAGFFETIAPVAQRRRETERRWQRIATILQFRWRAQMATVSLADSATNAAPSLAALPDLVRPPDGITAIDLKDGRRNLCADGEQSCGGEAVARREGEDVIIVVVSAGVKIHFALGHTDVYSQQSASKLKINERRIPKKELRVQANAMRSNSNVDCMPAALASR